MTRQGRRPVLSLFLTAAPSSAISLPSLVLTRGALARRRSVGAGTVLGCGLASLLQEARRCLRLRRPPKRTVREEASWLFLTHHTASRAAQRATLDHLQLRAFQPWATRCWLFDNHLPRQALSHSLILRSRRSLRLEGGSSALWKLLRDGLLARPPQDEGGGARDKTGMTQRRAGIG